MDRNRTGAFVNKPLDPRRLQVLGFLEAALLFDERDREEQRIITAFVHEHPDCLERSNLSGHLTASAFVIDRERRHLLLIHHKALGRWLQPGGHADGDPDLLAVARREVFEETGLAVSEPLTQGAFDLDIHSIPERKGIPAHLHYDVRFLFEADGSFALTGDDREVHGAAWVPLAALESLGVDESVLRPARRIADLRSAS
jgi:8-oxo-dGTP pyrophosphatase MutT (NUDIX family)